MLASTRVLAAALLAIACGFLVFQYLRKYNKSEVLTRMYPGSGSGLLVGRAPELGHHIDGVDDIGTV